MSQQNLTTRRRLLVRGQVQGVGFRPHVYRLATAHQLAGYVLNSTHGATIEIEGPPAAVAAFERDLVEHLPPLARISELTRSDLDPLHETEFRIQRSTEDAGRRPEVTPDAATCPDCLRELHNPADRRHRYPFINCTNCGPRYSIIRDVPYDRPQTTMAAFTMCPACQREYDDPADRRFHAQPNACPNCGPHVELRTVSSAESWQRTAAVTAAARLLQAGQILAIKGIGGYHLACRADDDATVQRLRQRKLRDGKPLALMVPDVTAAREIAHLSTADEAALRSVAAPIVLVRRRTQTNLAPAVAPGVQDFGLMLPYAPLHHLLFAEGLGPLVMTSANLSGQPLTYRDEDAWAELADVADAFLIHNREIFRPVDDSVVFTFRDEVVPIRRARGYAPQPIHVAGFETDGPLAAVRDRQILAVGGELKSTVCLLRGGEAVVSEHLGDLTGPATYRAFEHAIDRLAELWAFEPDLIVADLHPRYLSTQYAKGRNLPLVQAQHHHAHIAGVMAEWGQTEPVVGLACDGTGYGPDGAVWGGEVLVCTRGSFERVGHLAYFPLVGGDRAAVETWRPAASILRAARGDAWRELWPNDTHVPDASAMKVFEQQAAANLNAPPTSSLGRVFDAAGFLLGLCPYNRHEAEAAMVLEHAAAAEPLDVDPLPLHIDVDSDGLRLSLWPTIEAICVERMRGTAITELAARFHETVARLLADAALRTCTMHQINSVALSGGCFANRRLLTRTTELLEAADVRVLYHRRLPMGDGGISLGQALVAAWELADK